MPDNVAIRYLATCPYCAWQSPVLYVDPLAALRAADRHIETPHVSPEPEVDYADRLPPPKDEAARTAYRFHEAEDGF